MWYSRIDLCQGSSLHHLHDNHVHNKFDRKVRETLEIQKHDCHVSDGGMNPDKGQYVTTTFWIPLLKYLRKSEETNNNVE